ncbi:tRNA uridine(34) 5-carboxymethylaminomethyl modification radical SAM/GNAT enzyme Elp3 [Candidatus Peregrinibacteria bacterium CG10_big_fil_rev_8_21_14_0_10_36_19]|nr:MAG: tRNA uridine(34) 5-carboxymethylaminomethyl modification radical SAM/GNAT enzyme Elp3 [Candidatus Peregrinibacteria bacterium CG10_big_fil_rev_8_21_14_0_10_36_19]
MTMDFSKIDLSDNQVLAREIIERASKMNFKNRREFEKFRNSVMKERKGAIFHNLYFIKAYNDLINEEVISPNQKLLDLIQKRSVRTLSGVTPVTVLTKPFPCPGRCIYCPTDVRMPKSYLPSQPAAQRAFRQQFNPYTQVFVRLKALHMTGHEVSKVELRVIGGTWSSYRHDYREWFVAQCLMAMNEFFMQVKAGKTDKMEDITEERVIESDYGPETVNSVILEPIVEKSLEDAILENETADVRCIGINIETRPDCINEKEIRHLRRLGVTKTEIGVQTTDDDVQEFTKRGHDLASVRKATALLKDAGFKIGYHMMPNLPGSNVELDKRMIGELFEGDSYQPDYLKIYPCMVIEQTELYEMHKRGEFEPYDDKTLEEVLYEEMKDVPEWCRVDRVARDIPAPDIAAGSKVSNIRQVLEKRMEDEGVRCRDIRYREIGNHNVDINDVQFVLREYDAGGGKELFLSYEDVKQDKLIALLRLRFPGQVFLEELDGAALIREVHVYGKQIPVGKHLIGEKQHIGWGTKLMMDAEKLAKDAGYKKMAVIAGIGTREYYRKKGYELEGTYMVREI